MNNVTNADISEEKKDSEVTSKNFVENLKVESIKNKLENEC